jgi:hypothetical protein
MGGRHAHPPDPEQADTKYGMMNVDIHQRSMLISSCRFTTGARGGFAPLTQRDIGVNR